MPRSDERVEERWLTRGVGSVGAASFFSDSGHEIATSVLPGFLTHTLGASPGALGVIEGVSDGLAGIAKLAGGAASNDEERRGRLASGGYIGTAVATGAIGLATATWQVGILRAFAWVARGARTPARDSLLASLAPKEAYGRAFGYERAMDNLGAVAGPLAAAGFVALIGIRHTFYLAAIPGVLAALAITVAAAEARRLHTGVRRRFRLELRGLHASGLTRTLLPVGAFELGNCATTLLILRATTVLTDSRSLTNATVLAILLYAGHNLVGSLISIPGGHATDRFGARVVFGTGTALFFGGYVFFALAGTAWPLLIGGFALAGAGIGLVETAESTLVARALPDELRGSGFGVLGGVQSLGDFTSSLAVGLLWAIFSPIVGFGYAAALMALAFALNRARLTASTTG
jgi:MFS family permease